MYRERDRYRGEVKGQATLRAKTLTRSQSPMGPSPVRDRGATDKWIGHLFQAATVSRVCAAIRG